MTETINGEMCTKYERFFIIKDLRNSGRNCPYTINEIKDANFIRIHA